VRDDAQGMREFIVGTGGANHTSLATPAANSEVQNTNTYGILKLTLHANSYDWQFVPAVGTGSFTDSGTQACH
jgi:acid phosphatase type 7